MEFSRPFIVCRKVNEERRVSLASSRTSAGGGGCKDSGSLLFWLLFSLCFGCFSAMTVTFMPLFRIFTYLMTVHIIFHHRPHPPRYNIHTICPPQTATHRHPPSPRSETRPRVYIFFTPTKHQQKVFVFFFKARTPYDYELSARFFRCKVRRER